MLLSLGAAAPCENQMSFVVFDPPRGSQNHSRCAKGTWHSEACCMKGARSSSTTSCPINGIAYPVPFLWAHMMLIYVRQRAAHMHRPSVSPAAAACLGAKCCLGLRKTFQLFNQRVAVSLGRSLAALPWGVLCCCSGVVESVATWKGSE